jgi:hypothetical protein
MDMFAHKLSTVLKTVIEWLYGLRNANFCVL